jgi:hypothetical protein
MNSLKTIIEAALAANKRFLHPNTAKNLIKGISNRLTNHGHKMPIHAIKGHMKALDKLKSHIENHEK